MQERLMRMTETLAEIAILPSHDDAGMNGESNDGHDMHYYHDQDMEAEESA